MKRLITLLFVLPKLIFSQIDGTINGYIYDSKSQLPLFGANVIIEGADKGAISDENGFFEISKIKPQSYNLSVSYIGYQSKKIFNVIIKSIGNKTLEIYLIESNQELDEVLLFESPFKKSKETPLSINTFSRVEIESYPGADNDVTKVVQSMPGLSPSVGGFRNDIIIRGGAPNETVYYLDEIEIPNINHFSTQGSAGGPQGMINISFIDEVTLSTSAFGVEYDNPLSEYYNSTKEMVIQRILVETLGLEQVIQLLQLRDLFQRLIIIKQHLFFQQEKVICSFYLN